MSLQQAIDVREEVRRGISEPRAVVRVLALGGILGPILFTAAFIAQALFKPGYSHLSDPVSALAAGPNGWVQDVNFFVFGPLMIAYAVGLHLGMRSTRLGLIGPALLVLSGLGLLVAGAFPARDASGAFSVGPGHMTGAFIAFLGAGTGLIAISRRMVRDPRWRSVGTYALASGIAILVLFFATGRLAVPDDAPLHQWAGLLQRATVAVWFPCTIVLALRLWHVERNGSRSTGRDSGDHPMSSPMRRVQPVAPPPKAFASAAAGSIARAAPESRKKADNHPRTRDEVLRLIRLGYRRDVTRRRRPPPCS
jgi:hypothetical membrane protein